MIDPTHLLNEIFVVNFDLESRWVPQSALPPLTHHLMTTSVTSAIMDDTTTHIIEGHVDMWTRVFKCKMDFYRDFNVVKYSTNANTITVHMLFKHGKLNCKYYLANEPG